MKLLISIGLNYKDSEYALPDCELDAQRMSDLYSKNGYNTKVFNAIDVDGFRALMGEISASNVEELVLYYSGHGMQLPNSSGIEQDKYEEALCFWNGQKLQLLKDDDFALLVQEVAKKVTVIIDCCHSGGMARSTMKPGMKPKSIAYEDSMSELIVELPQRKNVGARAATFLFASVESQVSYSTGDGGAFTNEFLIAVSKDMLVTHEIISFVREQVSYQRANYVGDEDTIVMTKELGIREALLKNKKVKVPGVGLMYVTWSWGKNRIKIQPDENLFKELNS